VEGKWRAYFELLRFPAVFTVVADVMMGHLVTHGSIDPWQDFALLVSAASCLYLAGMVLNDVYDADVDAIERPGRPIPSGRIAQSAAVRLGWQLLIGGICLAWLVSWLDGNWRPGIVGSLLAVFVFLYDAVLKHTFIASVVMGGCRFLNVLLGMSLATASRWPFEPSWNPSELAIAVGIGAYIVGLTWFARGEASVHNRKQQLPGIAVLLLGLLVLEVSPGSALPIAFEDNWPLFWTGLALVIVGRCLWAVWHLEPRAIQIAVRNSLRALIVIDAAIVLGWVGPMWACAVLALLLPMLFLERWASTT
jgi:4-hydroxybenzoate polyprenyltransferase